MGRELIAKEMHIFIATASKVSPLPWLCATWNLANSLFLMLAPPSPAQPSSRHLETEETAYKCLLGRRTRVWKLSVRITLIGILFSVTAEQLFSSARLLESISKRVCCIYYSWWSLVTLLRWIYPPPQKAGTYHSRVRPRCRRRAE